LPITVRDRRCVRKAGCARVCPRLRRRARAFGQPIIENQGISFPLADLSTDIDAARLLTWRAAWMASH
jgi:alkylation response protein AidB-like acyl-CoA dehydrogenase